MSAAFDVIPMAGPCERATVTMVVSDDPGAGVADFFDLGVHGDGVDGGGVDGVLARHGALLFRGFGLEDDEQFSGLVGQLAREQLQYTERSTKRTRTAGNVYSSTEYPASKHIASHSENSFQSTVPGKILFFAKLPSLTGGETPIASNLDILSRLDADILDELRARQIEYVRNFDGGFDLSWQEAFQTEDRAYIEAYCVDHAVEFEWVSDNHLSTVQRRPATRRHPLTGDEVWFNQLHLFHSSNLEPAMRRALIDGLGTAGLPRNARFGDGAEMTDEFVEAVRDAVRGAESVFPWEAGDVLIGDNLLVSHGRRPFTGPREIRVALIDPIDL